MEESPGTKEVEVVFDKKEGWFRSGGLNEDESDTETRLTKGFGFEVFVEASGGVRVGEDRDLLREGQGVCVGVEKGLESSNWKELGVRIFVLVTVRGSRGFFLVNVAGGILGVSEGCCSGNKGDVVLRREGGGSAGLWSEEVGLMMFWTGWYFFFALGSDFAAGAFLGVGLSW